MNNSTTFAFDDIRPLPSFFPHLTSTEVAPTSRIILQVYRHAFSQQLYRGTLERFIIPYGFYSTLLLIAYHAIPHKKYPMVQAARWPLLAFINWFQWRMLWRTSSSSYFTGFSVGLTSAWIMVWSWSLLVFMRPQWDAKRVRRVKVYDFNTESLENAENMANWGKVKTLHKLESSETLEPPHIGEKPRQRRQISGNSKISEMSRVSNGVAMNTKMGQATYRYFWQSYPDTPLERLSWAIDLVVNFRGPGWNWAISPLPSLPPDILMQLGEPVPAAAYSNVSSCGFKRFNTRGELCRSRLPRFVLGYFLLDALKVLMMKDPYYKFGPTTYALPAHLRPLSPFAMHIYRQCLSSGTIIACLAMVNYLPPLLISVVCGPRIFGLCAEAWYYPSTWGPFSNVLYKGLGGLWGNYWHQTFRQGFTAPTNYLKQKGYINARSPAAMLTALILAFGISGFIHWAGSVTLYAETYPSQLFLFFGLHGLGVLIQSTFCVVFKAQIKALPMKVRHTGNLVYTLTCLFSTGWILADEFARGGLWLWEPIPFSPLRALGLGEADAGWWCWEHIGIGWHSGKYWWESGIAL